MILLLSLNHEKWLCVAFQSESQTLNMAFSTLYSLAPSYTSATSPLAFYFAVAWSCPSED